MMSTHPSRRAGVPVLLLIVCCLIGSVTSPGQTTGTTETIRIGVLQNGVYEIVQLPLEVYVARVLAGEALPGSAPAAYEALAIAIRTYALGNRGRHRGDNFDLCDQTHCQVMRVLTPVTERAALATAGQIMLYRGTPASIYYSASCGGHTEKPSNVWPGADDPPYLPSQDDDGCGGMPVWSTELRMTDLQRLLAAAGFSGRLTNMRIASRNESGRVQMLTLDGLTPGQISGQELRSVLGRTIGWQYVQSTSFELTRSADAFRLRGRGYGHGVGMCVIGSTKLATAGESAHQILARYYPGTQIGSVAPRLTAAPRVPQPEPPAIAPPPAATVRDRVATPPVLLEGVAVSLPEGDEGERQMLSGLARKESDAIAAALSVPSVSPLNLRFHPTTNDFERATGQPWFVLGAHVDNVLHFVPLVTLRERGVLERTVRHQLVHLLTDATFAGRPAWVREGAAAHFTDGRNGPPARDMCPLDDELLRPASPGAFGEAMTRARACFEWNLRGSRTWKDVK